LKRLWQGHPAPRRCWVFAWQEWSVETRTDYSIPVHKGILYEKLPNSRARCNVCHVELPRSIGPDALLLRGVTACRLAGAIRAPVVLHRHLAVHLLVAVTHAPAATRRAVSAHLLVVAIRASAISALAARTVKVNLQVAAAVRIVLPASAIAVPAVEAICRAVGVVLPVRRIYVVAPQAVEDRSQTAAAPCAYGSASQEHSAPVPRRLDMVAGATTAASWPPAHTGTT